MSKYIILVLMTIIGSLGAFFFKKASAKITGLASIIFNKWLYIGGSLYVCGAVLNIYLLKLIPYNIVMPLNSLSFVWTFILSYYLLKEKINKNKLIGIFLILFGVVILGIGFGPTS